MILRDAEGGRTVELRPTGYDADDRVLVEATVEDAGHRWELAEPCLRADEADELAGWLDGLATGAPAAAQGGVEIAADEYTAAAAPARETDGGAPGDTTDDGGWSSLAFSGGVLSLSGRRTGDDRVELRIAILGMRTSATGTTDVVVGLDLAADEARAAARDLALELAALPRG
ncbi:hypothetical protein P5G50_15705 [Leifsonia sp. F6_8S_P_1B]|uniref:DUF3710 domain-containing protein n=1 Tax=Leifsonia williamsii TaxID=3035919 RepID=A0ABT8KEL6_9MICO|nr:hypothetical protein [Leifsonia williamsii]MDN4615896.1 hypothetical protein [Leifsonia williamsii]